jgi:hypothetical protein
MLKPPATSMFWALIHRLSSASRLATGVCDVIGFPDTSEGGLAGEQGFELVVEAAAEFGADGARRYRVRSDPAAAEFLGHVAGEDFQSTLEARVGGDSSGGDPGGRAGQVHDVPTVGHQRQQCLGEEERSFEVHVEQPVELGFSHGGNGVVETVAGVVD